MCGCSEWGNTGAHGKVLCKQVKMHYCLCSFDGPGGGGDYSEDEQLDDPDEAQVCVCVRVECVGGGGSCVDMLHIPPCFLACHQSHWSQVFHTCGV